MSDFCVFGFAFCSGYGHMAISNQNGYYKKLLKKLLVLLLNYWLIIALFSVVSVISGSGDFMPNSVSTLLGNIFLYNITYNGAWWYMYAYVLLVLISPLLIKAVKKFNPVLVLLVGGLVYCGAYYLRFRIEPNDLILSKLGPFGMTLFEYVIGCVFYKTKMFSKVFEIWKKIPKFLQIIASLILLVAILIGHTLVVPSLFVAPATGIIIITLFHFWNKPLFIKKTFLFIGKHSTNIWLTHMFFYLILFKNLVYIAKYPLLIFLFMIVITSLLSIVIQAVEKPIVKKILA
jgi:hypothetical protein